jgi:hypothetical protein
MIDPRKGNTRHTRIQITRAVDNAATTFTHDDWTMDVTLKG